MQYMLDAIEFYGVASVGSALEAGYDIVSRSEDIDYFALALVSPLETQQYVYFAHCNVS